MKQPRLFSVIERRLLVNYRADPAIVAKLLPAPLRPQQIDGWAVAGICLIRLGQVRPRWVPGRFGPRSENAAHRIAVEWDGPQGPETGVYIPRRDTGSVLNVLAGGRLFPGRHHHASFEVHETPQNLQISYTSHDGVTRVQVGASLSGKFAGSTLFAGLAEASAFFQQGSSGYSPGRDLGHLDGIALATSSWRVEPVDVHVVRSTFFDNEVRFPRGSATFDCALLMRDVPVTWDPLRPMPTLPGTGVPSVAA
ncbi:MAG: hypothetical protein JWM19_6263 [Actinomycetia bacterium]|nr:hypothetical protein [Actinomycetes bacterium]